MGSISERIYDRFFDELEAQGQEGRRLARELRDVYAEQPLHQERTLVELYERLAREQP